jgi:hypothetical protein
MRTKAREDGDQTPHLNNALNVLPYDLLGRKRIAQRGGVDPLYNLNAITFAGGLIQGMLPVGYIIQPGAFIQAPPSLPINNTNFVPFSGLFSTGGLVVSTGPVTTPWSVNPLQPIGLELSLTLNVFSTLTESGGTFDPPAGALPSQLAVINILQQFSVEDAAFNISGPITLNSQIEWWTLRSTGTIHGILFPAPAVGFANTVFFAGIGQGAAATFAILSETAFQIGGPALPTQTAGATYTFGVDVLNGSTWTGVATLLGTATPLGGNLSPTVGIPVSTSNLSTLVSTPLAPAPFSSFSTFCSLVIS